MKKTKNVFMINATVVNGSRYLSHEWLLLSSRYNYQLVITKMFFIRVFSIQNHNQSREVKQILRRVKSKNKVIMFNYINGVIY